MHIDSESESEDELSSASVDIDGTRLDNRGRSDFLSASDCVVMPRGKAGTGGGEREASIGGGGGAKGGDPIEIGTLRTCRKMAEAEAGQMAESKFQISCVISSSPRRMK